MKKKLFSVLFAAMLFGCLSAGNVLASSIYPNMDNAEFVFQGTEYSDAINGQHWWHPKNSSIVAYGGNMWVEYTADLFSGSWNIGINVSNYGDLGTGWYDSFKIDAALFDSNNTIVVNEKWAIAASSTEINHDFFTTFISDPGFYTVRYTWLNDKYDPVLGYDANIMIHSAFFHDPPGAAPIPEPASMILLGTGLAGVAGAVRKRKKNLK